MDVIKTLSAGALDTKRYQRQYGDNLVCVRYRADEAGWRRLTTVEIIVDQTPLLPPRPKAPKVSSPNDQRLLVRVGFEEEDLRQRIKQAGGLVAAEAEAVARAAGDGAGVETRITRSGPGGLMATDGQECLDMDISAYPWQFVGMGRHFCLSHC